MAKSFLDLDYIIEINEQRVEQSHESYSKVLERFTMLIIIYSALAFFLIPICQIVFFREITNTWFIISFIIYILFFLISLVNTIIFMIPIEVAYLEAPQKYYTTLRNDLIAQGHTQAQIDNQLKVSYISELEEAVNRNDFVFRRKSSLYFRELIFLLISAIPYLICLAFHLAYKEDIIQKVQIVNTQNNSNFNKIKSMQEDSSLTNGGSNNSNNSNSNNSANNSNNSSQTPSTTNQTTRYPGVPDSQIIQSHPRLIKENKENPSKENKTLPKDN